MKAYTIPELVARAERIAGIPDRSMWSSSRLRLIARPRQAVMYALRQERRMSFPEIARRLGGKDHTTVMHGVNQAGKLRATDPDFAALCDAICAVARVEVAL